MNLRRTHLPVVKSGGKVCGASFGRLLLALIILVIVSDGIYQASPSPARTLTVSAAPGGITFAAGGGGAESRPIWRHECVGHRHANWPESRVIPLSNGALYFTHYQITVTGLPGPHLAAVTAFVNSNLHASCRADHGELPQQFKLQCLGQFSAHFAAFCAPTTVVASPGSITIPLLLVWASFFRTTMAPPHSPAWIHLRITLTVTDTTNNKHFANSRNSARHAGR